MEENGRHNGDHWREELVEEMRRRGWLLTMVSTVTAGALAVAGCSNDDSIPVFSSPSTAGDQFRDGPAPTIPQSPTDSRPRNAPIVGDGNVAAVVETDPVPSPDDAADDPAIWVDRNDPARSTVIGTDKDGGLAVYDLAGKQLQYLPDGELNNVDLRDGFPLGGASVTLVTAGNRSNNTIAIYTVNPDTRLLEEAAASNLSPQLQTYGSCMYRSEKTGKFHYFVTSEDGKVEQWELFAAGQKVDGRRVRSLRVSSEQLEGCVADDEMSRLYVGEEENGIWRYGAEPGDGDARTKIDSTGSGGHLVADVEGLTIAYGQGDDGYLVASSQGDNSYVVYERGGENTFVHRFQIRDGNGIDGTEDTDGIDVTTADLGEAFADGLFVAQDGENDSGNQNYKLVPWATIIGSA
jgi:3-phytase